MKFSKSAIKKTISGLVVTSMALFPVGAFATELQPGLTLDAAVDKALKYNKNLTIADLDLDSAKADRDDVNAVPGSYVETMDPAYDQLYAAFKQANFAWHAKEKNYEIVHDTVIVGTKKKYYAILNLQNKINAKAKESQYRDEELRKAKILAQLGMLSQMDLLKYEVTAKTTKENLNSLNQELNGAYQSLNLYIGLPAEERSQLVDTPVMTIIGDLDSVKIPNQADNNPSIWLAEETVDLKTELAGYTSNYDTGLLAVDKSKVERDKAKDSLKELETTLKTNLVKLEEQFSAAQQNLGVTKNALRIAKVRYELGLATQLDVLNAELSVSQLEQSIEDLVSQHSLMEEYLIKPWTFGN